MFKKFPRSPEVTSVAADVQDSPVFQTKAEELIRQPQSHLRFQQVLKQLTEYYEQRTRSGERIRPIFAGITPSGMFIELSRSEQDKSPARGVTVFKYELGADPPKEGVQPQTIAEVDITRGATHYVRLDTAEWPMPADDDPDEDADTMWRCQDAETVTIEGAFGSPTIVWYGHGMKGVESMVPEYPHALPEPVFPMEHYAAQL